MNIANILVAICSLLFFMVGADKFVRIEKSPNVGIVRLNYALLTTRNYIRRELLAGVEINKLDIALFYRREITNSFGLRIKYPFLNSSSAHNSN